MLRPLHRSACATGRRGMQRAALHHPSMAAPAAVVRPATIRQQTLDAGTGRSASGMLRGLGTSSRRTTVRCRAVDQVFSKFASQAYLDKAAQRFRVGLENGLSEDDLVAYELGGASLEDLSEVQRQYVEKLKTRLMERAEELKREEAERRAREAKWFEAGKDAYSRGDYPDSVACFERAAVGREQDCIDTYKWIEANHPLPKMRKQAENLRYIMEAPKLEISPDERVTIPLLNSQDSWRRDARKSGIKPRSGGSSSNQEPSYWDKVDWSAKLPFVPDKWYYRVLWVALIAGITVYFNLTARGQ